MKKKDVKKNSKMSTLGLLMKHGIPKKYELVIVLNPDIDESKYSQIIEKIKAIISSDGGELLDINDWGVRKLSYGIKKFNRGRYVIIRFLAEGPIVHELERNLRIMDDCLRYQTLVFTKNLEAPKEEAVNE